MATAASPAMTERRIQDALWTDLRGKGHSWMMPNFTPAGWWECDMFSLTAAGFMVEHEIKLSVEDFRADARKLKSKFDFTSRTTTKTKKHDLLNAQHVKGPARFYYVVPKNLVTAEQCPEFAGMIHVREFGRVLYFKTIKPAPRLHGEKCDPKVIEAVGRTCYWRFWVNPRPRDPGGVAVDYEI